MMPPSPKSAAIRPSSCSASVAVSSSSFSDSLPSSKAKSMGPCSSPSMVALTAPSDTVMTISKPTSSAVMVTPSMVKYALCHSPMKSTSTASARGGEVRFAFPAAASSRPKIIRVPPSSNTRVSPWMASSPSSSSIIKVMLSPSKRQSMASSSSSNDIKPRPPSSRTNVMSKPKSAAERRSPSASTCCKCHVPV